MKKEFLNPAPKRLSFGQVTLLRKWTGWLCTRLEKEVRSAITLLVRSEIYDVDSNA